MSKLKAIATAVALLGGVLATQAQAAGSDWATHDLMEGSLAFQSGSGQIAISDAYTFSLASGFTYDVTSMLLGFGITKYELFDSGNALLGSFMPNAGFNTLTLGAGNYTYVVSGTANNFYTYSLSSAITATAPVPEPETYAMMLAGLGALGFLASRRRG